MRLAVVDTIQDPWDEEADWGFIPRLPEELCEPIVSPLLGGTGDLERWELRLGIPSEADR